VALGERISHWRKRRKLTQEELAFKANVTKAAISNYENGHSAPSNETLVAIANALIVSTDYLLGRTDDPSSPTNEKSADEDIYVAFLGGPKKVLDEEEAAHLNDALEMFRAFREKKRREQDEKEK